MVVLRQEEYDFIFERLSTVDDVELLHKRLGLPKELLFNILGKKIVRDTTRRFYLVKKKSKHLLNDWKGGKTILDIARELKFPPALLTSFILEQKRYSKKRIKEVMKDPDAINNSRLSKEAKEAIKYDIAYSPKSSETQSKNGKMAESNIAKWLSSNKISYLTEEDNRIIGHHNRTPDFLLEVPVTVHGKTVNWFESKASFGDPKEVQRDYKKQISDYIKYFGPGVLIYWYGYVEGVNLDKVLILSQEFFL
jgi:hypothetical protein